MNPESPSGFLARSYESAAAAGRSHAATTRAFRRRDGVSDFGSPVEPAVGSPSVDVMATVKVTCAVYGDGRGTKVPNCIPKGSPIFSIVGRARVHITSPAALGILDPSGTARFHELAQFVGFTATRVCYDGKKSTNVDVVFSGRVVPNLDVQDVVPAAETCNIFPVLSWNMGKCGWEPRIAWYPANANASIAHISAQRISLASTVVGMTATDEARAPARKAAGALAAICGSFHVLMQTDGVTGDIAADSQELVNETTGVEALDTISRMFSTLFDDSPTTTVTLPPEAAPLDEVLRTNIVALFESVAELIRPRAVVRSFGTADAPFFAVSPA